MRAVLAGVSRRHQTVASASTSASLKPPSCIAPVGHSAAQMPQPRQMLGSTDEWASAPTVMVIAVCGQAVSQTPQATQTSTSLEAT